MMNLANHSQIVRFHWGVAYLIRDTFKRGKYQDVILPLTVLRRLDCVLEKKKEKVLATQGRFKGRLDTRSTRTPASSGYCTVLISAAVTGRIDLREEVA